MNESVGKKIVEALKRQAETEVTPVATLPYQARKKSDIEENIVSEPKVVQEEPIVSQDSFGDIFAEEPAVVSSPMSSKSIMDESFDSMAGFTEQSPFAGASEPSAFEMPSNIVVLKKLIAQLPSGVSRHTGAQIIKQTMEALGISMRSVLQDAQQVQENLKNSAKECQSYIQEYKKQIVSLEKQSQNYQKQYAALNDLISLFIQANK